MPKNKKNKKSKSWFFKMKTKFLAFFTGFKNAFTAFTGFFNFAAKAKAKQKAEAKAKAKAEILAKEKAYQEVCNQAVLDAPEGTDFRVTEEELNALKLAEDACRKAYQAKHKKRIEDYFEKHPPVPLIVIEENSELYKKVALKVALSLVNSPEKLALTQAGKAAQALKEKHIKAFTKAINAHGQGKLLKLNGICLERIQDVGGMNNNCGANVMLHVFLENWDKLNFDEENTKSLGRNLLRAARKNNPELEITTIAELKAHIDSFNFTAQEKIFTPAVRKHLGKTLERSGNYFQYWVEQQLPELDRALLKNTSERNAAHQQDCAWDPVLFKSPEYTLYYKYRFKSPQERADEKLEALQQTPEFLNASDPNKAKMIKEIEDKRKQEQAEKEGLERALFKSRYDRLGDQKNAIQIAEYELFNYADIMGVKLKVYLKNGPVTKPLYHHHNDEDENPNLISVNIVNLGAFHWQYERNWDQPKPKEKEVLAAPVLPPVTTGKGPKVPPAKPKKEALVLDSAAAPAPAAMPDKKPGGPIVPPAKSKAKLKNK